MGGNSVVAIFGKESVMDMTEGGCLWISTFLLTIRGSNDAITLVG